MRILFWSLTFWPNIGGVEVLTARMVSDLRRRGHDILVIAPRNYTDLPAYERYRGVPVHRLDFQAAAPSAIDRVIALRDQVIALKRSFAPELIHLHGVGATDFFHLTTHRTHPAPVVVTLHNAWLPEAASIVAQTLEGAQWVVGVSRSILDRARRLTPAIGARSSVILNAVAAPRLAPRALPYTPPRLLFLGRLAPDKGADVAVDAFRLIHQRWPDARLTIAGSGPLAAALAKRVIQLEIRHAVDAIGWVLPENVPSLLNEHTLVLMPSREDTFGLVALEAALMARPVVATRVGGLPEIVVHDDTGLLVDADDAQALAGAASRLLAEPETARRYGAAARRRALAEFGWHPYVNAYDALYRRLAGAR